MKPHLPGPAVTPGEDHGPSEVGPGGNPRRIGRRILMLVATGLALHVVAPGLLAVFGSVPDLKRIEPAWFVAMIVAETLSLVGAWGLMRVAVPGLSWRVAATSQLAGNAISRLLPGGAAAGTAVTYRIWSRSGIAPQQAASGLLVTSLVSTLTLLGLPAGALLVAATGTAVPHGLLIVALGVVATAVALAGFAALLLFDDRAAGGVQHLVAGARRLIVRSRVAPTDPRWVRQRTEMKTLLGRRWRDALASSTANWGFDIAALVLALAAMGSRPHVSMVILAYVTGAVLGMIPITPGGLGFVEAGLLGGLTLAGVPTTDAVVAVLAYRIVSYWLPIGVGLAAYGRYRTA